MNWHTGQDVSIIPILDFCKKEKLICMIGILLLTQSWCVVNHVRMELRYNIK